MNASPKRLAKALLGRTLVRSGLWQRALRKSAERGAVLVLTYHRVIEKWGDSLDSSQPGMVVTVPTFERQIAILKEHFEVVPLSALLEDRRTARRALRPRCVITFDDGWRDNYDVAFPILRRHDIAATIFLATDFIGSDRAFWHTALLSLFRRTKVPSSFAEQRAFRAYPEPVRREFKRLADLPGIPNAHDLDSLIETVKASCHDDAIEELVQSVATALGTRRPVVHERNFFLDWDQVRTMVASGIEMGSHGCSHRILTRLPASQAHDELVRSKTEIERRIGRQVRHFAFPNDEGTAALVTAAGRAGYQTACLGGVDAVHPQPGIRSIQRMGMHEGVCGDGRSFHEPLLHYWLFRAPKVFA